MTTFCESQSALVAESVTSLSNLILLLISICEQTLHRGLWHGWLHCKKVFLERVSNCCRLRGCLFASMMGLDNLLLKRLSVRMFSQSLFTFFKKVAMDGWNSVMRVMRFSLVFLLELRVKDLARTMCDAWLICLEINL